MAKKSDFFTIHYFFGSLFPIHYINGHYSLIIIPHPDPHLTSGLCYPTPRFFIIKGISAFRLNLVYMFLWLNVSVPLAMGQCKTIDSQSDLI